MFKKLINSIEKLKVQHITKNLVYVCKNRKIDANAIVIKFNRKDWIVLHENGKWEAIEKDNNTVNKLRHL